MKSFMLLPFVIAGLLTAGCRHAQPVPGAKPAGAAPQAIVTPDNSITAKVLSYNVSGRFVVLGFPVGQMPNLEQSLFLYRNGMKVGEVKVTGPQRDNNIVADLVSGEAQAGDEVRDQ